MSAPSLIDFTPVPLKRRHDGWTPELQRGFIAALAGGATIDSAALAAGKSRTTAYALRNRPGGESFAAAWDRALAHARRARLEARRSEAEAPLPPPPATREEAFALLDRLFAGWDGKACKADGPDRA